MPEWQASWANQYPWGVTGYVNRARVRIYGIEFSGHWSITDNRSEEHTSELQSLMRISYAVFCLKKKTDLKTTPPQLRYSHTMNSDYARHDIRISAPRQVRQTKQIHNINIT